MTEKFLVNISKPFKNEISKVFLKIKLDWKLEQFYNYSFIIFKFQNVEFILIQSSGLVLLQWFGEMEGEVWNTFRECLKFDGGMCC